MSAMYSHIRCVDWKRLALHTYTEKYKHCSRHKLYVYIYSSYHTMSQPSARIRSKEPEEPSSELSGKGIDYKHESPQNYDPFLPPECFRHNVLCSG